MSLLNEDETRESLREFRSESLRDMSRLNENKSKCTTVDKQEFVQEFSQLSCPCRTRTKVAKNSD